MAISVSLFLTVGGSKIEGEPTVTTDGRAGSIECLSFQFGVNAPWDGQTAKVTGRRQYTPVNIAKIIDKSSPLLLKALSENTKAKASFKFYRPNPAGDGTTEQFYTVDLDDARISGVVQSGSSGSNSPPTESIELVYETITCTYTKGGVTHKDSWK